MSAVSFHRFTAVTAIAALAALAVLLPASIVSAKSRSAAVRLVNPKPAAAGEQVKLLGNRDFKVTGECEDYGAGDYGANSFLQGKRDNLAYTAYSPEPGFPAFDDDYDLAQGPIDFTQYDASGKAPDIDEAEYYEFYGEGKGGRVFKGHMATSVHAHGADCNFGGVFFDATKNGPVHAVDRIKAGADETVTIYENRDFRIKGTCMDTGGGDRAADSFLEAKRPGLAYYLTDDDAFDTDLDPGDPEVDMFPNDADGGDLDFIAESYTNDVITLSRRGDLVQARIASAVHARGADCTYSAMVTGPESGGKLHAVNAIEADGGTNVTIYENRDFRVSGRCSDNGLGDFTADTFMQTKHDNAAYEAYDFDDDTDFDKADGKINFTSEDAVGPIPYFVSADQYTDFWAESESRKALAARVATGVNILGADCVFAGFFVG